MQYWSLFLQPHASAESYHTSVLSLCLGLVPTEQAAEPRVCSTTFAAPISHLSPDRGVLQHPGFSPALSLIMKQAGNRNKLEPNASTRCLPLLSYVKGLPSFSFRSTPRVPKGLVFIGFPYSLRASSFVNEIAAV
jgi:hypothetical protein